MRIAVIADVHGNLLALEAVLADIARHGVDLTVNLGDAVSGPLQPAETAKLLMKNNLPTVRGIMSGNWQCSTRNTLARATALLRIGWMLSSVHGWLNSRLRRWSRVM
jgi:predicted phosphodiesterase